MRVRAFIVAAGAQLIFCLSTVAAGQEQQTAPPELDNDDVVATLVGRLELEQFKGTLEGLTQFGDRAQGTQRNRDAVDWIEARLQAVGCTSTGRVSYEMPPRPVRERSPDRPRAGGPDNRTEGTATGGRIGRNGTGPGGSVVFGYRSRTGGNTDPLAHPDEMYIIGAHMDGRGWGEAANDDGSGTAIVMELARIFNAPDVQTERSIRFALWNSEETGLNGSRAYVEQRQALQGHEDPPGLRPVPGTEMARDDPARHDALRSRRPGTGR